MTESVKNTDYAALLRPLILEHLRPIEGSDCSRWRGPWRVDGVPIVSVRGYPQDARRAWYFVETGEWVTSQQGLSRVCGTWRCMSPAHFVVREPSEPVPATSQPITHGRYAR